jgi:excisionase family DNA binding protein
VEEVLTVGEVAEYLRVHRMTVQRWCRSGSLPAAKIGRAYRIRKRDFEEWWVERSPRATRGAWELSEAKAKRPVTEQGSA